MKKQKFVPGLYLLEWKTGGSSLASVGVSSSGKLWYAPTNGAPGMDWSLIKKAHLLMSNDDKKEICDELGVK